MRKTIILLAIIASIVNTTIGATAQVRDEVYHVQTSDSVDLYVHVKGQGEPCLYLHGGPGAGSTWMEVLGGKCLEEHFTMIYLDQRGVCKSTAPAVDDYSLDRQVEDWETVRRTLGFEQWHLLGHSFGGVLMMSYWQHHPECIKGMVFMNCTLAIDTSFRDSWLPTALSIVGEEANPVAFDTTRTTMERLMAIAPQLNDENRWTIFTRNKVCNDLVNSWDYHKDCKTHGKGDIVLSIDEYWHDFRPLTATVNVPVLYFFGRYDRSIGPEFYKGLHFPNAIIRGADCGHFSFLEVPELWEEALIEYKTR